MAAEDGGALEGRAWDGTPAALQGLVVASRPMRAHGCAAALGSLLTFALAGCGARNQGEPPPEGRFFFPSGVLLDPLQRDEPTDDRLDPDALPLEVLDLPGPRYLYVANGNNDRSYNAGTLVAIDLRKFWRAWYDPHRDDPAQASCLEAIARARASGGTALATLARQICAARDPRRGGVDPYCHTVELADGPIERCVLPPGSDIVRGDEDTAARPCRRLPLVHQVAECDEEAFVADAVRVGDFATTLAYSHEGDGVRLWLPVRGDPSVTYVDVRPDPEHDTIVLDCNQDEASGELKCGDDHRLDHLRSDASLDKIDREPFNMAVWERDPQSSDPEVRGQRLAFVAHSSGGELSLIDLDGVRGGSEPAIVDLAAVYQTSAGSVGGYGLAVRPCFAAEQGPLGAADPVANVPSITQGCTRPLVYTSFRFAGQVASFTASGLELEADIAEVVAPENRVGCEVWLPDGCHIEPGEALGGEGERPGSQVVCDGGRDPKEAAAACECNSPDPDVDEQTAAACEDTCRKAYAGPYCATPEQVDRPCAVECEPQVRSTRRIPVTLVDPFGPATGSSPVLGAMAFADPRGDQLLVLQTNPGALLSIDTSLGDGSEPLDIPSAPPVEICAEPSNMKIYVERNADGLPAQRYAIISCFRAALVYVVDLEALRVIDAVVVGTGPHDIAIDEAREVAYVINNLESSVSVIDLSRRRTTRFQELARLGLQDPFTQ